MNATSDKLALIRPELIMLLGACGCLGLGLSASAQARRATVWLAAATLVLAGAFVWMGPMGIGVGESGGVEAVVGHEAMLPWVTTRYIKLAVVGLGLLLLAVTAGVPEHIRQVRQAEEDTTRGRPFEPGDSMRGEFFAFFILSLVGVMLCAGASDLVWLFMALELTSLPTYVMVAMSRDDGRAREAAVKYFFLGALAAAVFLYGFVLIYGVTGSTDFTTIRRVMGPTEPTPTLLVVGLVLAVIGVSFKIAAVPMHFYVADVYEGAAVPVTAFLAVVPKTAGFVALIGLMGLASGLDVESHRPVTWLLWGMAALTMTIGNVLGLLQRDVKRLLAYSSVAHSGYMLVGLLAAVATNSSESSSAMATSGADRFALGDGVAGVLFYLVAYSLATVGAFAVLGCVSKQGREASTLEDLAGLGRRHPFAGAVLVASLLSLIGLPPLVGFMGKIYLFGAAVQHGYVVLVVIGVLNSAVSAVYYLRIVAACYFDKPNDDTTIAPLNARWLGASVAALGAVLLGLGAGPLVHAAKNASSHTEKSASSLVSNLADR